MGEWENVFTDHYPQMKRGYPQMKRGYDINVTNLVLRGFLGFATTKRNFRVIFFLKIKFFKGGKAARRLNLT